MHRGSAEISKEQREASDQCYTSLAANHSALFGSRNLQVSTFSNMSLYKRSRRTVLDGMADGCRNVESAEVVKQF